MAAWKTFPPGSTSPISARGLAPAGRLVTLEELTATAGTGTYFRLRQGGSRRRQYPAQRDRHGQQRHAGFLRHRERNIGCRPASGRHAARQTGPWRYGADQEGQHQHSPLAAPERGQSADHLSRPEAAASAGTAAAGRPRSHRHRGKPDLRSRQWAVRRSRRRAAYPRHGGPPGAGRRVRPDPRQSLSGRQDVAIHPRARSASAAPASCPRSISRPPR